MASTTTLDPGVITAISVFGFIVLVAVIVAVVVAATVAASQSKQEDSNEE
ncbi:MAG: hypothetical protein J6U10_03550 [Lachnospiraceae bacterium]|nr:hypothetical protein [Lachnospiraceae bacterium]MBP5184116.1 hypothetical protein [Lachnospiraceae bacterium]